MNFLKDESAQSVVEYILILSVVVVVFFAFKRVVGSTVMSFWQYLVGQISKGCPTCNSTFD